jgi:hypothetical protein
LNPEPNLYRQNEFIDTLSAAPVEYLPKRKGALSVSQHSVNVDGGESGAAVIA